MSEILGKEGHCELGFDTLVDGKVTARQAAMLNRVKLPSASGIAKVDDMELQEIMGNVVKGIENLIKQLKGSEDLLM